MAYDLQFDMVMIFLVILFELHQDAFINQIGYGQEDKNLEVSCNLKIQYVLNVVHSSQCERGVYI